MIKAQWVRCVCGDFWCVKHEAHAHTCLCPPVHQLDFDPYAEEAADEIEPECGSQRGAISSGSSSPQPLCSDPEEETAPGP